MSYRVENQNKMRMRWQTEVVNRYEARESKPI